METEKNHELVKKRMEEHQDAQMKKLEDQLYKGAVLRSFDVIALEALKLGITNWHSMPFEELRFQIKKRQDEEKAAKKGAV